MIAEAIRTSKRAVIPYVTAGLPDLDATGEIIRALSDAGAAAIEIGIPFSDPIADGPVLQKASHLALEAGFTLDGLMSGLPRWSAGVSAPLIVMSYINPFMRRGMRETLVRLRDSGIQGVIIPDLPCVAAGILEVCRDIGIDLIRFVAPTTTEERMREVVSQCSGFVYAVTIKGVTGERSSIPPEVRRRVQEIKSLTDLPVCTGFGVSTTAQVEDLLSFADGVIVGSHLMARVMDSPDPVEESREVLRKLTM
ncbi:MAG TPA: tryptophan synthase subunit alpha [Deltaproteobacteria bacterium]|nr:tryptophan synthase subunit alpha [Deltaproteobacteria bacterium]